VKVDTTQFGVAIQPSALEENTVDQHQALRERRLVMWEVSRLLVFGGFVVANAVAGGKQLAQEQHSQRDYAGSSVSWGHE
jgi:hypothetical protein